MTRAFCVILSYLALILAGCAAPVAGPGGTTSQGAPLPGGLVGGSNATSAEAGGSGASVGSSGDSSGDSSKDGGSPSGNVASASPQGGIPSGSVAPTPDTGDTTVVFGLKPDRQDFFRGSRVSECKIPGGRTSVHVTGRVSVSIKGGPEQPVDVDKNATLQICYSIPGYGNFDCIEAPFDFSPRPLASVQLRREPKNYVDATVTTSEPDTLSYKLIFRAPMDNHDDVLAQFHVTDELEDASLDSVPDCFNIRMQMKH